MSKKNEYTQHPAVYITKDGAPSLHIFNNFFKDYSLPKWKKVIEKWLEDQKKKSKTDAVKMDSSETDESMSWTEFQGEQRNHEVEERFYVVSGDHVEGRNNDTARDGYYRSLGKSIDWMIADDLKESSRSWFYRFLNAIFRFGKKDALKTFDEVKDAVLKAEIPTSDDMQTAYKNLVKVIAYLRSIGQIDQARDMARMLDVVAAEVTLTKNGYTKFITQKEVIDFMLKAEKGVMVDFVRSYKGIIPPRAIVEKNKVDELMVFDNYVVMYYDPDIAKFELIRREAREAEERKRRDPILFGMIQNSDRLYYVTDWTTEEDDLTLEKLETTIGRRASDIRQMKLSGINAMHDSLVKTMAEIEQGIIISKT